MNNVTASFNKTVRQITEMFQWPKCISKKMTKIPQRKKTGTAYWQISTCPLWHDPCPLWHDPCKTDF